MKFIKLTVIAVFAFTFMIACSQTGTSPDDRSQRGNKTNSNSTTARPLDSTDSPKAVVTGKEIYSRNCMICHKSTGVGGKITIEGNSITPDDLTSAEIKAMTDEKLIGYVTDGVLDKGMPAFKDKLSEEEIRSVVSYIRELQTK